MARASKSTFSPPQLALVCRQSHPQLREPISFSREQPAVGEQKRRAAGVVREWGTGKGWTRGKFRLGRDASIPTSQPIHLAKNENTDNMVQTASASSPKASVLHYFYGRAPKIRISTHLSATVPCHESPSFGDLPPGRSLVPTTAPAHPPKNSPRCHLPGSHFTQDRPP